MSAEKVFLGWGLFDAMYIARYIFISLSTDRVPYVEDFNGGLELLEAQGEYSKVFAVMVWGFELSILLSCVLFIARCGAARWVAWFQIPFRLIFLVPSVSIIFMGPDLTEGYDIGLLLLLLFSSECLKGWTLWRTRKSPLSW
ncbi:hypothetical protein ACI2KS_15925 [Pseudomonas sp. NPDC087358]|uniref:hypothetical protein n=1 Tax=Pseudomonas sp. NPDC087358 TaxID=3364439 RepID=UPI00384CAFFD